MEANVERLKSHVQFLTDLWPPRNYRNMDTLNQAAEYIYAHLEGLGFACRNQNFALLFRKVALKTHYHQARSSLYR